MFKDIDEKYYLSESRIANLKVMRWCLYAYKKTGDSEYYDWAMKFGEWSKYFKGEMDKLSK